MSWSADYHLNRNRKTYNPYSKEGRHYQNATTPKTAVYSEVLNRRSVEAAPVVENELASEPINENERATLLALFDEGAQANGDISLTQAARLNPHEIWKKALSQLEMQLPASTFNTWVRDTSVQAYEDREFIIGSSNAFVRDWLQNRLRQMIKRTLSNIVGQQVQVQFMVCAPRINDANGVANTPLYTQPAAAETEKKKFGNGTESASGSLPIHQDSQHDATVLPVLSRQPYAQTGLKNGYTFDSLVVGKHNQLASAAAQSIVDKPGKRFNPLFVYGGVGLGKTHLLHAIGNKLYQRGFKTLYCTSEQFTNELISAIRSQSTDDFRNKYRELDLLLIDDIQFIGGKDSTQEEFFHTFNQLFNSGKQVVISSDKLPKAVPTLENRLRSRFEGGLQVDISLPDFETRVAILEAKARERHLNMSLEVLKEIAGRVESNVRELEGTLNKLAIQAELFHSHLDVGMARNILQDLSPERIPCPPNQAIAIVARHYGLNADDLTGARRTKEIAHARHVAMYSLRTIHALSLPVIGQHLGGRDHTTISHGIEKIEKLLTTDELLRREATLLREKIHSTR